MRAGRVLPWVMWAVVAAAGTALGSDPGELFPDVKSYDDQVQAPISKPQRVIEKRPVVQPEKQPEVTPEVVKTPVAGSQPAVEAPVMAVVKTPRWSGYRERLLTPLMSASSHGKYEREYAPRIAAAIKSKPSMDTVDRFWKDAQAEGLPGDLKRMLMLNGLGLSIRAESKLDDRVAKARAVLPLLQEETLAVAQARADAVTELAYGALANASDDLLAMVIESQCKLARMQVQGGFADDAVVSLKSARDAFGYLRTKTEPLQSLVAEAASWVNRAADARGPAARWQATLATNPGDTAVNTQLALLNLSLYGDVAKASLFAGKSGYKELQALAAAAQKTNPGSRGQPAADALVLADALLAIGESGSLGMPFDRYSIATLVEGELADLGSLPEDQATRLHALQARAATIVSKSGLKPPTYPELAALSKGKGAGGAAGGEGKLVLFVKDSNSVVKYLKATPKQDAEALVTIRKFAATTGEATKTKFTEIVTDHCIVFTDWDPAEHAFLKTNVEGAYAAVAKFFDVKSTDNIFPGKLPVFMFSTSTRYEDFAIRVADKPDGSTNRGTGRTTIITRGSSTGFISSSSSGLIDALESPGLFRVTDEGLGVVAMYKPSQRWRAGDEVLANWGVTLTWNMTHAFVGRYRTNKPLPGWLDTGIAAHVAYSQFPLITAKREVLYFAQSGDSIEPFFVRVPYGPQAQAVCETIVNLLKSRDHKAFTDLIDKIKDGEDPDKALKDTFRMTPGDVARAWRIWANS